MTRRKSLDALGFAGKAALALLLLAGPGLAWANNMPGPQTGLGFIAALIAIPLFTLLGGGASILRRLQPASRTKRVLSGLGTAFAVLVGIVLVSNAGTAIFALFGALLAAIHRGGTLISWGVKARQPESDRPAHLEGASRWRLVTAGTLLIIVGFALTQMGAAFVRNYPTDAHAADQLRELASAMTKHAAGNKGADGLPRYVAPEITESGKYKLAGREFSPLVAPKAAKQRRDWYAMEVKVGADGKGFQAWAFPVLVPVRPWNHVFELRSFYIDQTGQLRMIRVYESGVLCPPDAPVYAGPG